MKKLEHGDECPICSLLLDADGLTGWEEIAACALAGFAQAVESWRHLPSNSIARGQILAALTTLHNALAEHAEALDPERFHITHDANGDPVDGLDNWEFRDET
jgi:hypothetical protein